MNKLQSIIILITLLSAPLASCKKNEEVAPPNYALQFDGLDGTMKVNNSKSLNPINAITISMWLYLSQDVDCNSDNNWRGLIQKGWTWGNSGYDIILEEDASFAWDIATTGGPVRYFSTNTFLLTEKWTYVTFVYDASTSEANLFFNGILQSGEYGSTGSGNIIANSNDLYLNTISISECSQYFGNFPGSIDDLSIWSVALSNEEIITIMEDGLGGTESGLISYWNFNEGSDSTAVDLTGNNNGLIYGGVSLKKN